MDFIIDAIEMCIRDRAQAEEVVKAELIYD